MGLSLWPKAFGLELEPVGGAAGQSGERRQGRTFFFSLEPRGIRIPSRVRR